MTRMMSKSLLAVLLLGPMAFQASAGVQIGGAASEFRLSTYDGDPVSLDQFADKVVVLEWFAHDCEFTSSHYKKGAGHMQKLQEEFTARGVVWLTIDSNRNALPPKEMQALARDWKIRSTAFLSDPTGRVGLAYGVTTTPQMFVVDRGNVVYQGAIDDRSSFFGLLRDRSTARNYVRQALEELLDGKPISVPETKPYGCHMKYAE